MLFGIFIDENLFSKNNIQDKSRSLEGFYKQTFLKVFAKFTGKQLCWSLFYNKVT